MIFRGKLSSMISKIFKIFFRKNAFFARVEHKFLNLAELTESLKGAKLTKPGDFRGSRHFDLNLGHLKVTWSRVMAKFIQQNNTSASYSPPQLTLAQYFWEPSKRGWNAVLIPKLNDIYVRVRQAAQSFGGPTICARSSGVNLRLTQGRLIKNR